VLARCGAYFEQVCRTVLSLRHHLVANLRRGPTCGPFSFCFKGVCPRRPNL
jgi:hypothetical protein